MPRTLVFLVFASSFASLASAADDPPRDSAGYLKRGVKHLDAGNLVEARADLTEALRLDPKNTAAWDQRGNVNFFLGRFKESVADFDKALELRPADEPGHWRRGISLYYAGDFTRGRKQFEGYEKVDTNDVENAVWHFLCVARQDGLVRARAGILKIGKDKRVPMNEVYDLFKGTARPAAVLAAADATDPDTAQGRSARFYAHLYLGIYHDLTGEPKKALEHLELAAGKYRIRHYMGEVARVHRDGLKKKDK
jgi:lipoprotein NlpI